MRSFTQIAFLRLCMFMMTLSCIVIPGQLWGQTTSRRSPDDVVPREYFGMHIHRADQGTKWPGLEIGAWRLWDTGVIWPEIQPQEGTWDFSRLDRQLAIAERVRADVLFPFGMTPSWASSRPDEKGVYRKTGDAAEPARLADWEAFIQAVVRRYKGRIRHYDVWNEVNAGTGFFTGTPEAILALQRSAFQIIKREDPGAILVTPSVVGEADHQVGWFDRYLALGAGRYADVISYHFYQPRKAPEEIIGLVQRIRSIMERHGVGAKPLWNTESGYRIDLGQVTVADGHKTWPALSQERAAGYAARALVLGWWAGLDRFYWYAWDNRDLGFVDSEGNIGAAGRGYLATARWLTGSRVRSCTRTAAIWVCALERDGKSAWMIWNEANGEVTWNAESLRAARVIETLAGVISAIPVGRSIVIDGRPVLAHDGSISWGGAGR